MKNSTARVLNIQDKQSNTQSTLTVMKGGTHQRNLKVEVRAEALLAGLFNGYYEQPAYYGENPYDEYYAGPWNALHTALVIDDTLDPHRTEKAFKEGVWLVTVIIHWLKKQEGHRLAIDLLDSARGGSDDDYKATRKLLEVLPVVFHNDSRKSFYDIDEDDYQDLEMDLKTILYAQELVLKARS